MSATARWPTVVFAVFTIGCIVAALLLPPMAQPLAYHEFVDQRTLLGVENFMNVVSNAAFVLAGLAGFLVLRRAPAAFEHPSERLAYLVFFAGLALTGAGSWYYHLDPNNETLFWDRLPMTIAFAGLVSAQIAERIGPRIGVALLLPMLAVGAASVFYWIATERAGVGNVLPYAILQGYAMFGVLLLALTHASRYTRAGDIYWIFAAYLAAKVTEALDGPIWQATGHLVSGHTLKHVFAALAGVFVCTMLLRRQPVGERAAT